MIRQKIRTFLGYDNAAEEAANLYVSLFPDSKIVSVTRYGEAGPAGSAMIVVFQLAGIEFIALNGGPHFQFTEAISLTVDCETQDEVDRLWDALTQGGSPSRCGWLKDQFGLSWQIVPSVLGQLLGDQDSAKSGRARQAMLTMSKLNIVELQRAFDGA